MKYSITIPFTLVGSLLDLATLGYSKRAIDVSPLMTKFPFFLESTKHKEQLLDGSTLLNKGFAGLFRAVATVITDLPLTFISAVLGAFFTALHTIFLLQKI